MTLPYPLLARGKIIDTDMELSEKEKFELQVRENAIRMQIPYGFTPETDVDAVISRADKIAKYILQGEVPTETTTHIPNAIPGTIEWADKDNDLVHIVIDPNGPFLFDKDTYENTNGILSIKPQD